MTRILLVDDHAAIRKYLHSLLEEHEAWKICGEAENGKQAVDKFDQIHPDVTIIDFQMPEMNGLDASRAIIRKFPDTKIVMLTVDPSEQLKNEAKKVGIKGFCSKSQVGCIVDAVSAALRGETHFGGVM